uniref:Beta-galactosidase n=1 Tax=Pinguiococcus pyrenoidosus TaxID=172671 RepID=A0A7R9YB17_9STRA|mmetsp:Transcript_17379/g.66192  ORF Transcript_17379/g.66192 Transcript_17379/m.66192 type:complete len:170 (+) Transcript_17379:85-594(+)
MNRFGLASCGLGLACLFVGVSSNYPQAPSEGYSHEKFITWGFEDWDFPPDDFKIYFDGPVSITRIEGFVAASMLPEDPRKHPHKSHYIRQALLSCHNGTRGPLRGEHAAEPWTQAEQPNRLRRYEQSLTLSPVEINIKQHDRVPVHLPVRTCSTLKRWRQTRARPHADS